MEWLDKPDAARYPTFIKTEEDLKHYVELNIQRILDNLVESKILLEKILETPCRDNPQVLSIQKKISSSVTDLQLLMRKDKESSRLAVPPTYPRIEELAL